MVAWKGQLARADAESLVAYIKSLWSFRSIACQGTRHMGCMRHRQGAARFAIEKCERGRKEFF